MNKQELHNKRHAHERAYTHNNMEVCDNILAELKAEKYDVLVSLLKKCEWQLAYEWINDNV